ncbi:MAG TPA: hypothetical protein VK541_24170 [Pedobacter sp.]|uniref:hypothetical protein n=1 Tax=Pedobacter sp. TaxID=1411316 RepID=UPI002B52F6C1|nr:hypothetical protein [Pedobacter sp.]HMI05608.1 hypothetical protein [Pedobacter sp.]
MELNKDKNLQDASKIINRLLKVDNILCFGERSWRSVNDSIFQQTALIQSRQHYYLTVISETEVRDILQLQDELNGQMDKSVSISLLVHTEDEIAHALAAGSRFFHKIFQKADQMYLHSHFKTQFCNSPVADPANALMLWQDHYQKATAFQESAGNLLGIDDNSASLYLIIESLEHACTGLLQACLDYQPKRSDLTYLLPLCNILSNQLESIFPRKTPADESHFQLLSKRKCFTDKNPNGPEDPFTIFFLHQQCVEWLKAAREVFESSRHTGHT